MRVDQFDEGRDRIDKTLAGTHTRIFKEDLTELTQSRTPLDLFQLPNTID